MPYTWNSLTFERPDGLVDQTVVSFVDNPEQPTFTVTMSSDARGAQAFPAYVDGQLAELARSLPGYTSSARMDESVNGKSAVVVEHKARSPQGQGMRQRQAYVDLGAQVAILAV